VAWRVFWSRNRSFLLTGVTYITCFCSTWFCHHSVGYFCSYLWPRLPQLPSCFEHLNTSDASVCWSYGSLLAVVCIVTLLRVGRPWSGSRQGLVVFSLPLPSQAVGTTSVLCSGHHWLALSQEVRRLGHAAPFSAEWTHYLLPHGAVLAIRHLENFL
jgi:hypothetical protein